VAAAGLLDGKRATTHWYYLKAMLSKHPGIAQVKDRRFVVDRGVATTTGITASMPMMLTLIEAIGGRAKAEAVALELGLAHWDARHRSDAFVFNRRFALTVMGNAAALWSHEQLGLKLEPGIDEVSVALVGDAWSRTYRSRVVTFADSTHAVQTRAGLRIVPDRAAAAWPENLKVSAIGEPARALDRALLDIAARYGERTADVVAMQLEYPRGARRTE
jgi:transcriptional regulator GlxA family with amidase domain